MYDLPVPGKPDFETACALAREWDYNSDARIALGIFFERALPTFEERMITPHLEKEVRDRAIREFLETRI